MIINSSANKECRMTKSVLWVFSYTHHTPVGIKDCVCLVNVRCAFNSLLSFTFSLSLPLQICFLSHKLARSSSFSSQICVQSLRKTHTQSRTRTRIWLGICDFQRWNVHKHNQFGNILCMTSMEKCQLVKWWENLFLFFFFFNFWRSIHHSWASQPGS